MNSIPWRLSSVVILAWVLGGAAPVRAQEPENPESKFVVIGKQDWREDFKEHWEKAKGMLQNGKYQEAVGEAVWCLDHQPVAYPEFDNNLTTGMVEFIYDLRQEHLPADRTLEKRRAAIEKTFRKGKGNYAKGLELEAINQKLGDWGRTLELYDELGAKGTIGKRMQRELFMYVEESLLEEERYEDLLKGAGGGPGSLEKRKARLGKLKGIEGEVTEQDFSAARMVLCRSAARYYQAMLSTDQEDEAAELARAYTEYHKTGDTYVLFIQHAVKAKKYGAAKELVKAAKKALERAEFKKVLAEEKQIPKAKKSKTKDETKDKGKGKTKGKGG